MPTVQGTDKDHRAEHKWKNPEAFYLIIFSPEFQTLYPHFYSPYKKDQFKMKFKMVC